jgi:hypothetical protein
MMPSGGFFLPTNTRLSPTGAVTRHPRVAYYGSTAPLELEDDDHDLYHPRAHAPSGRSNAWYLAVLLPRHKWRQE